MQTTTVKISNGKITLPKSFVDQLGLKDDIVAQAKIEGNNMVIEVGKSTKASYRVYSDAEIDQFLKDDQLPKPLVNKIRSKLSKRE